MCLKKDDTLQQTMFALLQGVFCRNRIRVYPFELTPRISADHNPHHSMGFSTSQGTIQSNGSYSIWSTRPTVSSTGGEPTES